MKTAARVAFGHNRLASVQNNVHVHVNVNLNVGIVVVVVAWFSCSPAFSSVVVLLPACLFSSTFSFASFHENSLLSENIYQFRTACWYANWNAFLAVAKELLQLPCPHPFPRFSAIYGPKMATNVSVIALNWSKFHLNGFSSFAGKR